MHGSLGRFTRVRCMGAMRECLRSVGNLAMRKRRLDEATKDIMKLERGLEQKVGPPHVMHLAAHIIALSSQSWSVIE